MKLFDAVFSSSFVSTFSSLSPNIIYIYAQTSFQVQIRTDISMIKIFYLSPSDSLLCTFVVSCVRTTVGQRSSVVKVRERVDTSSDFFICLTSSAAAAAGTRRTTREHCMIFKLFAGFVCGTRVRSSVF